MQSLDELALAISLGASAVGLVSAMPSGFGPITDAQARAIALRVPPPVLAVLLTSRQRSRDIIAHVRAVPAGAVQMVDRLSEGSYQEIRDTLPGVRLIQVIHVTGPAAFDEAMRLAVHVDALLLDSGRPDLPVKELGGTGRVHDWRISRRIREQVEVPVFLAGGLTPENVGDAVCAVRPFAIDVCTGVRTGGRLDAAKLERFFEEIASARLSDETR